MISTLYLLQYIAFYLWQSSSKYRRYELDISPMLPKALEDKKTARITGMILLLLTSVAFVFKMGIMSGICSFVIGLMGMGCLSVIITPFRYLRLHHIAVLYICSVALEIFI